jgi:hypothetical protein
MAEVFNHRLLKQKCDVIPTSELFNEQDYQNIKTNNLVYVKTDHLKQFVTTCWRNLEKNNIAIILITGDSSVSCPKDISEKNGVNWKNLVNSPVLIHWFTTCMDVENEKISAIPIGLPITIHANLSHDKVNMIGCYTKFYKNLEQEAVTKISQKILYFYDNPMDINTLVTEISCYRFALCPKTTIDHSLIWILWMARTIPIVNKTNDLYFGLPVLEVDDWANITQQQLDSFFEKYRPDEYLWEKLTFSHWFEKIMSYKKDTILQ